MIIFAGPSIAHSDINPILDKVDIRPPARVGDIYNACRENPVAIGLVDGFFEGVPAVWHKEILWAMTQGIVVFGASSMGALRAAELHAFGMIGVGWIFEGFRDGRLEDDDEVALRHGPPEMNYVALSEPMVNIRATLDRAVSAGQLDQTTSSKLTALAKAMYFPERSWDALLARAPAEGIDSTTTERLRAWLPEGRVDQKRQDAIDMLRQMASCDFTAPAVRHIEFDFKHTVMWEDLKRQCGDEAPDLLSSLVLDQLRHDPDRYYQLRKRAAGTLLADTRCEVPSADLDKAVTRFRSKNQLYTGAALDRWLSDHGLSLAALRESLEKDLVRNAVIADNLAAFRGALLRILNEDGDYDAMMAEAERQADIVHRAGVDLPTPESLGLSHLTLLIWYFEDFRGEAVPHDIDLFLRDHDFADREDFEQMMARQFVLWQSRG